MRLLCVVGLGYGDCLETIAKGCDKLTRLSLAFIGGAAYNADLAQMLIHLKRLKDLRSVEYIAHQVAEMAFIVLAVR